MHEFVSLNNQILSACRANLPAVSSAAFYGKGVFTTLAFYKGKPLLWDYHWRRLISHAARLDIDLSDFSKESVRLELLRLMRENETLNGRARISFFDARSGGIWQMSNTRATDLLITTADFRIYAEKIGLTFSSYPINSRSPLTGIKSCNYLENMLAFQQAAKDGFAEAVRINEKNEIVSACLANIFWIKEDKITTPPLEGGALAGTVREFLMEKFPVSEVAAKIDELRSAEAVFLTSSGIGISEVENFDRIRYQNSELLSEIKKYFAGFVSEL